MINKSWRSLGFFLTAGLLFLLTPSEGEQMKQSDSLPDIVVSIKAPQRMSVGDDIRKSVMVKISNIGKVETGPFRVSLKLIPVSGIVLPAKGGGLLSLKNLPAGQSMDLMTHPDVMLPRNLPSGRYTLRVEADPDRRVKERDLTNNVGSAVIFVGPRITRVNQVFAYATAPLREIFIEGLGFGESQGSKTVMIGPYVFQVHSWRNDEIIGAYPSNLAAHGATYSVRIMDGEQVVSNEFQFFLKMVIFKEVMDPHEGIAGTPLTITGMGFGSSQGQKKLMFGNQWARVQSWSNSSIRCIIPKLPAGKTKIFIEENGVTLSNEVSYTIMGDPGELLSPGSEN